MVMFRYLLDTQREVVLERDKGGGKRPVSRKAVYNAIVPRCERVRHSRCLYLLRWAIGSTKLIKETAQTDNSSKGKDNRSSTDK